MKSVLLVNQYFWPDMAATAQLLADLAEDLAKSGYAVSVLTGKGSYAPGRKGSLPKRETWSGVEIRRVWCTDFGRDTSLGRMADYLSFLSTAGLSVLFGRRHDIVVCLSTPPLVASLGLIAKRRGAVFVYKVEDLYPDVAVALGALRRGSLATRFFGGVSKALLRRADQVVALDGAMRRTLEKRGARKPMVIPNWADGARIRPDPEAGLRFRSDHGLENRFVVLYSGNLGRAHRFDAVLEAARRLEDTNPEVVFLFVGGGPGAEEIRVAAEQCPNIRLLPYQPRERLNEVFNCADIHLVTLRPEVAGLLVPSKYVSALAAAKPVLLVGGGSDLEEEIHCEGLGWVTAHDPESVASLVSKAASDPAAAAERGLEGRRRFDNHYDRPIAMGKWRALISGEPAVT